MPEMLSSIDEKQFLEVRKFRSNFERDGEHPGLFRTYHIPSDLGDMVVADVLTFVDEVANVGDHHSTDFSSEISQYGFEGLFLPQHSSRREAAKRMAISNSVKSLSLVAHSGFSFLRHTGHVMAMRFAAF